MQINQRIQNPTNFFFNQAKNETDEYAEKIQEFTKKLINTEQCILCKEDYNLTSNIPRILIHCGHTFCHYCLMNFHKNNRVRCPMCLKLIKQVEFVSNLPINHTIFTKIAEKYNLTSKEQGIEMIDAQTELYKQFELRNEKKGQQRYQGGDQQIVYDQNGVPIAKTGPRIDEESGLEWCQYHPDRIKHFLCIAHRQTCCRACNEVFHNKNECNILDLYEIEDMHGFLEDFYKKTGLIPEDPMAQTLKHPSGKNPQVNEQFNYTRNAEVRNIDQANVFPEYSYKGNQNNNEEEDEEEEDEDEGFEDEDDEGVYEDLEDEDNPVVGNKRNYQ